MPMATPELRAKMKEYFNHEIDDARPSGYLASQGYKQDLKWNWHAPKRYKDWKELPQKERDCILFLQQEWDEGDCLFQTEYAR